MTNMDIIYKKDWFSNRTELGEYIPGTDNSLVEFDSSKNLTDMMYTKNELQNIFEDISILNRECRAIAKMIITQVPRIIIQNKNDDSWTDFSRIVISGLPITKSPKGTKGLDIVYGYLIHESCHIKYTDKNVTNGKISKTLHWIWNVLEDECIEECLNQDYSGMARFLGKIKTHLFGKKERKFINELDEILNIFFAIIRYPVLLKKFNPDLLDKHKDIFNSIYNICEKYHLLNPEPKDLTKHTFAAAKEIFDLLKDKIEHDQTEEGAESFEEMESNSNAINNPNAYSIGNSSSEEYDRNEVEAEIDNIEQRSQMGSDEYEQPKDEDCNGSRGNLICPTLTIIDNRTVEQNEIAYKAFAQHLTPLVNEIKKISFSSRTMHDKLVTDRYRRNGTLDPNLLPLAYQNVQNVFNRKQFIKRNNQNTNKFAIVLAIDESGSMICKDQKTMATKLAIIFSEAFKNNPDVELYVYGHGDYIVKYGDPKDKKSYYRLGCRMQSGGQNEILAYNTILRDVRKSTDANIMFINITDGLYLYPYEALEAGCKDLMQDVLMGLIIVGERLNASDRKVNDDIYGPDNWISIESHNTENWTQILKSFVTNINKISKQFKASRSKIRKS